ncbi:hypothetical protein [Selenomonas sp. ND2010]|uniref:hypothetical protein n=1 Tax=Selenomonas sp. ND2010 TaxID=1410618 RepID=UPI00051BFE41|nr:hypothetical protein [Selenomonas sp. ND2010]
MGKIKKTLMAIAILSLLFSMAPFGMGKVSAQDVWAAGDEYMQHYVMTERTTVKYHYMYVYVKNVNRYNDSRIECWTFCADEGEIWVAINRNGIGPLRNNPLAKNIFYVARDYLGSDFGSQYGY